jgi:F0F1-type ATP synthase membrane subunit b/b'
MDMILNVLQRLQIDSTIIPTFFIVILFYLLINFIFFKPLLSVIVTREQKTTKLEEEANAKSATANQMMNEYKQKLENAYIEAQKVQKTKKSEVIKAEREKYLAAEKQIIEKNEQEISSIFKDLSVKRQEVLGRSEELSKLFVEKLT